MIIRFFRAIVQEGQENAFRNFFLSTALPLVRSQEGLVSVRVGLPPASTPTEFSMMTVWRDLEVLKGFAGEDWKKAVIHPDEANLLRETYVHHYEVVDL
jgi:heme-degrading monooxygenase HmoA